MKDIHLGIKQKIEKIVLISVKGVVQWLRISYSKERKINKKMEQTQMTVENRTTQVKPLYWKNDVERIRGKVKILSRIPGNFLDYESCNFIQACLLDYAELCEKLQKKKTEEKTSIKYKPTTPIVLFNSETKRLRVVWKNRTMGFTMENHETKAELDKEVEAYGEDGWTPEQEVEMAIGSGYKRLHDTDNDRWELWDAGKLEGGTK